MFNSYGYNPYYSQQQRYPSTDLPNQQQMVTPYPTPINMTKQNSLLGKSVDNIDVVKAMDIPLDGSISYLALTDGTAIVSKQLQIDGTSKMVVYKPVETEEKESIKFATLEDIEEAISEIDLSDIQDLKDEIKDIKKQLKEFRMKKGKDE